MGGEDESLRAEISRLQQRVEMLEQKLADRDRVPVRSAAAEDLRSAYTTHGLNSYQVCRYSRQLLVPAFGIAGQEKLLSSSILVIGCGGLGSSAALYLAAAGVGVLGLVDRDTVELNNLHRQIIHSEEAIGTSKVRSAATSCRRINSSLSILEFPNGFSADNALEIVRKFDVVVDATDNLPSRYLISDACVVARKPLVSGAALGLDGQLTVYNHKNGPCYRCLFPVPPPQSACQRCSDSGVLGVVPGIIGSLEALEAIKLASGTGEPLSSRMLIFDASLGRFQNIKLRAKNPSCVACGDNPEITEANFHNMNYEAFTGVAMTDEAPVRKQVVSLSNSLSCLELRKRIEEKVPHVLLDVRDEHQYAISALPQSTNIPLSQLQKNSQELRDIILDDEKMPVFVICRRGNSSQEAVELLRNSGVNALDVTGGLEAWSREVDSKFPLY
ncbi:adenylyltransferase and sulfurtransferase MOCS3-1 [Selaginella moellendorffii]|uniref:adenylyltransferase and sulfurtransferase MOCS3-1 n=1 Tax=Selaginella moellendorffii TaxID=88036 RepID=UPI000D1CE7A8|nr:adenylyltransferase and sulfurtransferase MOCS3-1 [Selaginella moellendorffii]|eukprot:XP_024527248.1 adenylyltransferase and sulfurtransferase MOCS3-1 [Selaginella moellendorffii]